MVTKDKFINQIGTIVGLLVMCGFLIGIGIALLLLGFFGKEITNMGSCITGAVIVIVGVICGVWADSIVQTIVDHLYPDEKEIVFDAEEQEL